MDNELRIIISGGGTGGHIFPAISIANAIKAKRPDANILFVGALGRMEMQRVPAAGYEIKGLPICGFDRKHLLKNFIVLFKILRSECMARGIVRRFTPMASGRICQRSHVECVRKAGHSVPDSGAKLLRRRYK